MPLQIEPTAANFTTAQILEHLMVEAKKRVEDAPFKPLTPVRVADRGVAQTPVTSFLNGVGIVLTSDQDWTRVLNMDTAGNEHIDSVRTAGLEELSNDK